MFGSLLRALPPLVLAFAALESFLVRRDLPHRPVEGALFLQSIVLWLVLGLLACVPAWGCLRLVRRGIAPAPADDGPPRPSSLAPALVLLGWMAAPVLAHGVLDRHTGLAGSLGALAGIRPWLEVGGVLALLGVALVLAARLGARLPRGRIAAGVVVLSLVTGFFLPWRTARVPRPYDGAARPNLLFLVWDTMRADRLQPYGYERETTPHLARFAAEATVFEEVRSVSCFTFTSHLSMLTGVYPSTHGARMISMRYDPQRAETVADTLRRAGYRTGGFVGTDVLAGRTGIRYGFETYDDRVDPPVCDTKAWKLVHDLQSVFARKVPALRNNGLPHWIQDFQRPAGEVLDAARAWIEDGADDPRPWFCMVNLYDVHWPYVPRGPGRTKLVRDYDGPLDGYLFRSDAWQDGYEIGDEDARHVSDLYDAEVHDLDLVVDEFLAALDLAAGDTAVLMTSDHGEAFGEADRWKHEDITEIQVRVPLIVRPAEPRPVRSRVATRASGVDVAPTLLGLAGLAPLEGAEGIDLLAADAAAERALLIEDRDQLRPTDVRVALYQGPWKLVRSGLAEEATYALYDLGRPASVDLEDVSAAHPEVLAELMAILEERRRRADEEDARSVEAHQGQADALEALGYTGHRDREPEEEAGGEPPEGD